MSTCPYCGDGPMSVGTGNHIECVEELMGARDTIQAALESLKCCGNCGHYADFDKFFEQDEGNECHICDLSPRRDSTGWIEPDGSDPCHFTPSKWVKR